MANIIYRNQANKIFIYNSADEEVNTEELAEQKNTSSITILTSGIPEYHIRIKNNFKSEAKKNNFEECTEDFDECTELKKHFAEPQSCTMDSKTSMNNLFCMNEDVLLKNIDEKFYLGTIVNILNGKYLVKFDDNTEKWSNERGLQKLNSSLKKSYNEDDPLCVVCKVKNDTDVVEICHLCSRGYHRHCTHRNSSNFSSPWCCDRCTANEIISISDSEDNENEDSEDKANLSDNVKTHKRASLHRDNNNIAVRYKAKRKRSQKFYEEKTENIEQPNDDSSDESSNKSTLDWIIPPPSNFHGKNNPFHSQYKSNTKYKASDKSMKKRHQNGFEKLPEIRIVRTIKRRLSAKDIAIGLNRETKRRKIKRRKSCDIEIISEILQPLNMPLRSYLPVRGGDAKEFKSTINTKDDEVDPSVSGESSKSLRMRRYSRNVDKISKRNSSDISLNGDQKNISLAEAVINSPVKTKSINMYFGALNRIENGDRFTILAKRLTFDGKEQYLLDWDAPNNNCATIKNEL